MLLMVDEGNNLVGLDVAVVVEVEVIVVGMEKVWNCDTTDGVVVEGCMFTAILCLMYRHRRENEHDDVMVSESTREEKEKEVVY